jgi:hypothetical protein
MESAQTKFKKEEESFSCMRQAPSTTLHPLQPCSKENKRSKSNAAIKIVVATNKQKRDKKDIKPSCKSNECEIQSQRSAKSQRAARFFHFPKIPSTELRLSVKQLKLSEVCNHCYGFAAWVDVNFVFLRISSLDHICGRCCGFLCCVCFSMVPGYHVNH